MLLDLFDKSEYLHYTLVMKTYELPEEPDGNIVYSSNGIEFTKHCDVWRIEGSGNAYSWADILEVGGPLTEFPPYNVGENISSNEVWNLSSGSIFAEEGRSPWFRDTNSIYRPGDVYKNKEKEMFNKGYSYSTFTILRVGNTYAK